MKRRITVLPFTDGEMDILLHLSRIYEIGLLVSPKGIGLEGDDPAIIRNIGKTGYIITNSIEEGVHSSDVVLISALSDNRSCELLRKFALTGLEEAAKSGKEIFCFLSLSTCEEQRIEEIAFENGALLHLIPPAGTTEEFEVYEAGIQNINVPVICVADLYRDCDGYKIFLDLIAALRSMGISTLGVSSDAYNDLFDIDRISFDPPIPMVRQVRCINHYIHELYLSKPAQIIVIHLPHPIMSYSNEISFDSGLSAYAILQAIPPESLILCGYTGISSEAVWDLVLDTIRNRFDTDILGVHISNTMIDPLAIHTGDTFRVSLESVRHEVEELNHSSVVFFNQFLNASAVGGICDEIVAEYIDIPFGLV